MDGKRDARDVRTVDELLHDFIRILQRGEAVVAGFDEHVGLHLTDGGVVDLGIFDDVVLCEDLGNLIARSPLGDVDLDFDARLYRWLLRCGEELAYGGNDEEDDRRDHRSDDDARDDDGHGGVLLGRSGGAMMRRLDAVPPRRWRTRARWSLSISRGLRGETVARTVCLEARPAARG